MVHSYSYYPFSYALGWTALHMAASFGHEALVSLLLEAGASVNRRYQSIHRLPTNNLCQSSTKHTHTLSQPTLSVNLLPLYSPSSL